MVVTVKATVGGQWVDFYKNTQNTGLLQKL